MRLAIDNATRFFAVVGAPYLPERHDDRASEGRAQRRNSYELAHLPSPAPAGSWLNDGR
jgi:hypothetical protein